jgi:hypothetical protein
MKKNNILHPLSFIKRNLMDINSAEQEQKLREKEFRKEWAKWGKPKKEQV